MTGSHDGAGDGDEVSLLGHYDVGDCGNAVCLRPTTLSRIIGLCYRPPSRASGNSPGMRIERP